MKSLLKNSQFAAIAFLACAASVFLSGCASIVNGTKQTVSFNSTPSGAKVYLDGVQVGTTPYVCEVKRGRCPEVVFKKDGFIPEKHKMTDSLDAAPYFGGNLGLCLLWVVPGVVGFIADPITGAMWEYDFPNVNVQLTPEKADAPVKK